MNKRTLVMLGLAAIAIYFVVRRRRVSAGSIVSNTGGASQGMVLPNAAAAQRDTDLYGYGSGS